MSAVPNVNPLDASWRVLQDCEDKHVTPRALSRDATQLRLRRQGTKCYDDQAEHAPNPHVHLSLVASGLQMPAFAVPSTSEPVSTEKLDSVQEELEALMLEDAPATELEFDGAVALELIGEDVPETWSEDGLPDHFHHAKIPGVGTSIPRHVLRHRLSVPSDCEVDFDPTDHEVYYSGCEQLYLLSSL